MNEWMNECLINSPLWGFSEIMNQLFKQNIIWQRIPTGRRQTGWLFTSVAEDLNSGLLRTNPASGQGPVPERLINTNPGKKFCSDFVLIFYVSMHCLE